MQSGEECNAISFDFPLVFILGFIISYFSHIFPCGFIFYTAPEAHTIRISNRTNMSRPMFVFPHRVSIIISFVYGL